jgi:hypothetical protein
MLCYLSANSFLVTNFMLIECGFDIFVLDNSIEYPNLAM